MNSSSYPLWLADTHIPEFLRHPVTMVSAEGITLTDSNNNTYIDFFSGNWNVPLGYSQRRIVDAVFSQLNKLPFAKASSFASEPAFKLASTLAAIVPVESPRCYFCNSGSEAVETAIKMVRQHTFFKGNGRKKIIVLEHAYHGQTLGALAASGVEWCKEPFSPHLEGFVRVPIPQSADDVEDMNQAINNDPSIGAVFIEPVLAVGGVIPLPEGYLQKLREVCNQHDLLLVCDEITTGIGRCGMWFVSEECRPDILLLGKAITNGYLPLSVVVASRSVWQVFDENSCIRHGQTNTNHPVCTAAGVATLELMKELNAPQLCLEKAALIQDALNLLSKKGDIISIRGKGLLLAVEFDPSIYTKQSSRKWLQDSLMRAGYLAGQIDNVLILAPPFIVEEHQVVELVSCISRSLEQKGGKSD